MTTPSLDLVVKNVRVVRPRQPTVERLDVGVKNGRFARIAPNIPAGDAREVRDGLGLLGFPGVVDAHTHVGIYAPLSSDADSESKAAAAGGVTAMLTYFRTGQYYLNRSGPYAEFFALQHPLRRLGSEPAPTRMPGACLIGRSGEARGRARRDST